ncbi:hypothetical protein CCACVL1_30234 [Corchorus capsularis]|uniref:Uncharacterized protein n=1 Tax=Corchorus capsularis TaxID=210143 RepID=A0A1R3FYA1_COCAP|nr:hypothetical protein CCACVL1_30234 [Corchorus capsularis]
MEEIKHSPPLNTSKTTAANREQQASAVSRIRRDCLAFGVSLREGLRYVKAIFVGQAKRLTARNEQEATRAELRAQKMQVEAADEAEDTKKRIYKSM